MAQWIQIGEKLWELRHISYVLATISQQGDKRYSLYIAVPMQALYATKINIIGHTCVYNSMEEAKQGAIDLMKNKLLPWVLTMQQYLKDVEDGKTS